MSYDVAVVGAGAIGCALTVELAERGASVVLLERERVCAGASGAAAGMLAPQTEADTADPWFELLLAARAEHEPLACRLRHDTGIDVGYRRDGVLRVAAGEHERAELQARAAWQSQRGLAIEWLEPEDARKLEPALAPDLAGALWLPDESQLQSPRLVQALAVQAQRLGVDIREGTPVIGLDQPAGKLTGVRTPAERISAGAVVLAAGVWSGLVDGVPPLPLAPVKGQMACAWPGGAAPRHVVWGAGAYLTPKAGGELLIGATMEPSWDARPTLGAIAGLIAEGARLLPVVAAMPLHGAWAGLRPALPDHLPAIGPVPGLDGLFVATGHYRNGILLAPLTAKLLAPVILGEAPVSELAPYSPARLVV